MAGYWKQYPWSEEPVWIEEPEPEPALQQQQTSYPTQPAPTVREYGVRNPDGTVSIWETDDQGNAWPTGRAESWATNQGVPVGGGNVGGGDNALGNIINRFITNMNQGSEQYKIGTSYAFKALEAQIARDLAQLNLQKQQWITQLGKSPRDWIKYWQAQGSPGGTTATPTGLGYTDADIANINQQLVAAGWGGGTDEEAVAAFLNIVAPGTQADLVARLQKGKIGGTTTTTMPPEPQWLKDIGGLGGLSTLQLSPKSWGQLQPSKQEAIVGGLEYMGEYEPDWMKRMKQTWPNMTPSPATAFRW